MLLGIDRWNADDTRSGFGERESGKSAVVAVNDNDLLSFERIDAVAGRVVARLEATAHPAEAEHAGGEQDEAEQGKRERRAHAAPPNGESPAQMGVA